MSELIHVLIIDQSKEWQEKLYRVLSSEPQIDVVGMANTGIEALQLAQQLQLDIVLLDLDSPETDYTELLYRLYRTAFRASTIVIGVGSTGSDRLRQAMLSGARDFVAKEKIENDLCASILRVSARYTFPYLVPLVAIQPRTDGAKPVNLRIVHRMWSGWNDKPSSPPPEEISVEVIHDGQEIVLFGNGEKYLLQVVQAEPESITLIINGLGLKQGEQRAKATIDLHGCSTPHQFSLSEDETAELYTCTMDAGGFWEITLQGDNGKAPRR